jgi:pSer/pThr/pTyr-binding forkhead associated (FHA) protein
MDQARYYPGMFDVNQLAMQLASNLQLRAYQAQWFGAGNQMMVQVRKGSDAAKMFGAQAALTVMLTQHPTGLLATIGQQRWADKAAVAGIGVVGAAFFLWPLLIPAAVGAVRQSNLPTEVLTLLDTLVLQQNPLAYPQPVPVFLMPQVQMVYQNPPSGVTMTVPQQLCPACHQPNNTGASFCQHCGTPLDESAASQAPTMAASTPPVTPPPAPQPAPPKAQPAKQAAPATTRVSRTAAPTERVTTTPAPVGPTGIFALPSGRRVPVVTQEAIVGRGNPDGTDPVEVDMTTEAESSTVSRRHARITRANGGFEIEDLNSANQTLLNNEQLEPGRRYALRKGDVVEFGKVKCTFSVQGK